MRVHDWQLKLHDYLFSIRETPFAWGTHDCVCVARRVVELVRGEAVDLGIAWASEAEARACLEREGGLEAWVTAYLGAPVAPLQLGAGDLALVDWRLGPMLAVHDGAQLLSTGEDRLRRVPWALALRGWRV